jgi:hypothetical protein
MPNGVKVKITPEDQVYARKQDRWACVIVRAVQRTIPQATNVMADSEHIRFSLPEDKSAGDHGTRYEFKTPRVAVEKIIKCFDTDEPLEALSFELVEATKATAITHSNRDQRIARRTHSRTRTRVSNNARVKNYNRFIDDVAFDEEA